MSQTDQVLKGIAVTEGIAIGPVYLMDRRRLKIPMKIIEEADLNEEIERYDDAVAKSVQQLKTGRNKAVSHEHREILQAHIKLLTDEDVRFQVTELMRTEKINVEWALLKVIDRVRSLFGHVTDHYHKEREIDLDQVVNRILHNLLGVGEESLDKIEVSSIVIAHDLSPVDLAHADKNKVLGIAQDIGGATSHTSLLTRAMGIPTVVGLEQISRTAQNGDIAILDASEGLIILNPPEDLVDKYLQKKAVYDAKTTKLLSYRDLSATTLDGHSIRLSANIEIPEEIRMMQQQGIHDIGLYRSEYLYILEDQLPGEEDQYAVYSKILAEVDGEVTIRTFDLGADKMPSNIRVPYETNPAMGLRAIRFCLSKPQIFAAQLRALLRASVHGNLRIMLPMISSLEEVQQTKEFIENMKDELIKEGCRFADNFKFGILIEVPSAVIIADALAQEVDFFSIGTNDLIQYGLAIDRNNEHVNNLFSPFHPAILRMIHDVVRAGHHAGIEVGMCGEMAGQIESVPLLIGLGLDELSMSPTSVLRVKRIIRSLKASDVRSFAQAALNLTTERAIKEFIFSEMQLWYPEELKEPDNAGVH